MRRSSGYGSFVLSCEAAEIRGNLRHSHISNRFLFYRDSSTLLEAIRKHGSELRCLLEKLVALTAEVDGGFSPVSPLSKMAAFQALSSGDQKRLLRALRTQYEADFRPGEKAARLDTTATRFLSAMDLFVESSGATGTHERLKEESRRLERELASLPIGVWLWP